MKRSLHRSRGAWLVGVAAAAALGWALVRRTPAVAPGPDSHAPVEQVRETLRAERTPVLMAAAPRWLGGVHDPSGAPIAAAEVCAECDGARCPLRRPVCTRADQGGHFVFAQLAPGSYRVIASAPGHLPATASRLGSADADVWLELEAEGDQRLDVELQPFGVHVSGEVADVAGGPVGGARITLLELTRAGTRLARAETRADGRFDLYTEAGAVVLDVRADGYARALQPIVAPDESLRIELVPAARLRGQVVSAVDGSGVPNVTLQVRRQIAHAATPAESSAISDATGQFTVDGLAPGRYRVTAQTSHGFGELAPVDLGIGDDRAVELRLTAAVPVSGRVLIEPTRSPCPGGLVTLTESTRVGFERSASIAPDGRVTLEGIPFGTYALAIDCTSALAGTYPPLRVAAEPAELTWTVRAGLRLRGHVLDAAGHGLAERTVEAGAAEGSTDALPPSAASTDAQGAFELTGLAPGLYRVVLAERPSVVQDVSIAADAEPSPVTLVVRDSAAIHVRLIGSDERRYDAYRVRALRSDAEPEERVASRVGRARFELRELPPGEYELSASDGQNPVLTRRLQLRAAETQHIEWNIPVSDAALSGRVLDARGEPVSDAWVRVTQGDAPAPLMGPVRAVLTQVDGRFSIEGLDPRAGYDLEAHRPPNATVVAMGLRPGAPAVLRLPAEPD
ncbi:MAG TPA: carboxypeptidase regulatory-like domain-containing protein [Polyangiales bacterium]|nr:carboxypeptidase regulatory-like domain-containing protein [Polyangiales bacterium]